MRKLILALVITIVALGAPGAVAHPGHSVTVSNDQKNEGTTVAFTLTVTPAPAEGETASVDVVTANGSAIGSGACSGSADYVSMPKTKITWAADETTKTANVVTCQDTTSEGDETFFLNLSDAASTCALPCLQSSVSIGDFQGVGTIVDDEATPALQITDRSAFEGAVGTSTFGFDVALSAPTNKTVQVNYFTSKGTASPGADFVAKSGELTFAPNATAAQTINITVNGDTVSETDETFFVNLTSPTNAKVGDPQGVGIIQNDDAPPSGARAFVIDNVTQPEGNTGNAPSTPFTFTVTLGQPPGAGTNATINYHVTEGTASAGSDYAFVSGTLTFANAETAKTITVSVVGDTSQEPDEAFTVNLTGASCSPTPPCTAPSVGDGVGAGTITNDDGSASPSPSPTPGGPTVIDPTKLKVGGYFQARVTAPAPCQAGRLIKVKKAVSGTDKVMVEGTTDADGLYKEAVRPKKTGRFYAQVYTFTKDGVTCRGGKSPVRTLPA
jgi:hypothetical protein